MATENSDERRIEDRIAQEFEAVAVSLLGERGCALVAEIVAEMRRQQNERRK